jgi:hypothetical protein
LPIFVDPLLCSQRITKAANPQLQNGLGFGFWVNEGRIQAHLDEVVRSTVEETLDALLDAEADRLCGAQKYERSEGRKDARAGTYDRHLQTKAGSQRKRPPGCGQVT